MRWDEAKEIKIGDVIRIKDKKHGNLLGGAVIGVRYAKGTVVATVQGGDEYPAHQIHDVVDYCKMSRGEDNFIKLNSPGPEIRPRRGIEDAQKKGG